MVIDVEMPRQVMLARYRRAVIAPELLGGHGVRLPGANVKEEPKELNVLQPAMESAVEEPVGEPVSGVKIYN